ncbi:MAG: AAA family ATPase [Proteobacteria bacterium]|nr:AAA family ATPase [Pseudomonadota bacterium]
MYTNFFGLNEKPFSITPDPRYLFMSERHGEALAHLVYGVTESGGFIQLTGEVGTGKTTLVRTLLLNRMPSNADVAVVLNPQLSALEFLETICEEVGVAVPKRKGSIKPLIDGLNRHLLKAHADGRRTILIVDEAQNLAPDVLEEIRLLTNLETAKQKLLQIILIGQPELREVLARTDLRQLAQRITGRYHLEPLSRDETDQYIEHRLKVAGALGEVFDTGAKRAVFRLSQGVPRLINVICDRALLGAYSLGSRRVDRRLIRRAAAEVSGESDLRPQWRWFAAMFGIVAAIVIAGGLWSNLKDRRELGELVAPVEAASIKLSLSGPVADASNAEPDVSLVEQLDLAQDITTSASALATLFDLWNIDYRGAEHSACAQAEAAGFSCLRQRGSWSGLRQLDRPAVLTLTDNYGDTHHVVLTAIGGEVARLSIGGVSVVHPIDIISDMWFGQYQLLWRPPNGDSLALRQGSRGPNVLWLRQSLAAIDVRYRVEPFDSDFFDDSLTQQVRNFQRDHRLDVDGLAGHQTQIVINTLLEPNGTPRLTTPRLAQE